MFNPLSLIESSPVSFDTNRVPNINNFKEKKHSFFIETLQFLTEINVDFYEAKRKFYVSVVESAGSTTDVAVVHESFGDFFDAIKNIIDRFLSFIKSLFERFVTLLNRMIGRDKYIINHKEEFKKFSKIHEFTITGFVYTFNSAIPVIEAKAAFDRDFIFSSGKDSNLVLSARAANMNDIKAATTTLSNQLTDGSWYDSFRSTVLGNDGGVIAKDDFADVLFKTFRHDESIAEEITIDSSEVISALRRFESSKKDIDDTKKLKSKIDSQYTSIRKSVESMVKTNRSNGAVTATLDDRLGTPVTLSNDEIVAMDNFVKLKVNQLQEMSNIHALAFAAKLDALTDCYKQDKAVLFKALGRVQSNKKEEV